jgi:hypothetical protein
MDERRVAVPVERIESLIVVVRGQRVLLDVDLARLYGTTTKALNQAVKRNAARFPADFLIRLTREEKQEVVTICDHLRNLKFSPALPNAFTEHGAIMAASVLSTERAVEVSVYVVRAFVRLREMLAGHKELAAKLSELEERVQDHDEAIRSVVAAIRQLMEPPAPDPVRKIGFADRSKPKNS